MFLRRINQVLAVFPCLKDSLIRTSGMVRNTRTSPQQLNNHPPDKDLKELQEIENAIFGDYRGSTDSSSMEPLRRNRNFNRSSQKRFRATTMKPPSDLNVSHNEDAWNVTKLKLHDPLLSKLLLDARSPKRMKKQDLFVAEGKRLIKDALLAGISVQQLIVSDIKNLDELLPLKDTHLKECSIYRVPHSDLTTWSSLTVCPGIMGICKRPSVIPEPANCLPITVICDNIREPNNLGSIFRVCAGLPCRQVIVTKGCTDPWATKCLRGGAGGQFRIPIAYPVFWDDVSPLSLNKNGTKDSVVFMAENSLEKCQQPIKMFSIDDDLLLNKYQNVVVVIGGETHGISEEAYRFVNSFANVAAIHVPMAVNVDSMNTASALAVILYEVRRQFRCAN